MTGPSSFYECAAFTIFISTVLGVTPLRPFKHYGKLKFKPVKRFHIITFIYIAVFTVLLIQSFKRESTGVVKGKYYKSNRVSSFGLLFEYAGGVIILYTIYTCSILKTGRIYRTLQNLEEIDKQLKKMGQKFHYWRDVVYQIFMFMLGVTIIFVIRDLQSNNMTREKLLPLSTAMWTVLVFPLVVLNLMNCQFAYTVLAIHNRFKMINLLIIDIYTVPKCKVKGQLANKIYLLRVLNNQIFRFGCKRIL